MKNNRTSGEDQIVIRASWGGERLLDKIAFLFNLSR